MQKNSLDKEIETLIKAALLEDCAWQDITSDLTIKDKSQVKFQINSRQNIIFCGEKIITKTFAELKKSVKFRNSEIKLKINKKDGQKVAANDTIATGIGDTKLVLAAERTILNLIQHLSGVATITQQFVTKLDNKKIKILDTRKTIPYLRNLQKYAVKVGGGENHRFNLSDMILIKDNHIAAAGSVSDAINAAKNGANKVQSANKIQSAQKIKIAKKIKIAQKIKIEVECDNIKQVAEAIYSNPDIIMLDNMTIKQITQASQLIRSYKNKKILIEVSGGIAIENIAKYRNLDIDFISVGSITHSIKAADIGLDILS